jgi:hypothetical protein
MAVDTAEKRFSMMNLGGSSPDILFEPDASVDLDDRQHLLDCYSGIAFGAPGGVVLISQARSICRFVFGRVHGRVN